MKVKISKRLNMKIKQTEDTDYRPQTNRSDFNETLSVFPKDLFDHNSEKKISHFRRHNIYDEPIVQLPNIAVDVEMSRRTIESDGMICKGDPMRVTLKYPKKSRLYNPQEFTAHLATKQDFFFKQ